MRISSPSRSEQFRPNSASRSIKAWATVLLPEPDSPVNQSVTPCRNVGGLVSLRISATAGRLNHSGSWRPLARYLSRTSVPEMSAVLTPGGTSSTGRVAVLVGQEDHLLEVDHLHADLVLVLAHRLLRGVGRVERLAGRVLARPGVVAADDEMRAAVVAADDRVQEHFARAGHPHRQREQTEHHGPGLVVVVDQGPIAADPGVMVHVARLGHADDRVDQQAAADLLGGPLGQLFVCPVQGVASLEGDDPAPAQRLEVLAQLGRRPADLDEIVVRRDPDHLEPSRGVMTGHAG